MKRSKLKGYGGVVLGVALIAVQFINIFFLNSAAYADAGSLVHGYTTSNVDIGSGLGAYSTAGSTVTIKDSSGSILGQTNSNNDGYFQFANIPDGYSYTLEVEPPTDNPANLLPYSMNLDVQGDTDLSISSRIPRHLITLHNESTRPSKVLFFGRTLLDGNPADDRNTTFQRWAGQYVGSSDTGDSQPLNVIGQEGGEYIYSSNFSVELKPGIGYRINQGVTGGGTPIYPVSGLVEMTPTMNLNKDSYYVFNLDTQYNGTPHNFKVVDQCGTPVPGVQIVGTRVATLGIRGENNHAIVSFNLNGYHETDQDGNVTIITQTQGITYGPQNVPDNGAMQLELIRNNSTKIITLSDPVAQSNTFSFNLPQCLPDLTPPTINYGVDHITNSAGWYNTPAHVFWTVADPNSAVTSQTGCEATTVNDAVTTLTCSATSGGGTSSRSATIHSDSTAPTVSNVSMTFNGTALPLLGIVNGTSSSISANVADNLSGVTSAEFFIDADPGIGNATDMTLSAGKATSTTDISGLSSGSHTLHVRSKDLADNWSIVANYTFIKL